MEAQSKRTNKVFTGKLAALMVKVGVAMPLNDSPKDLKAAEIVELINQCTTISDIEMFGGDTRKTVVKAFEKKKAEL